MKRFLRLLVSIAALGGSPVMAAVVTAQTNSAIPFSFYSSYSSFAATALEMDVDGDGHADVSILGTRSSFYSSSSSSSTSRLDVTGLNGALLGTGPELSAGAAIDGTLSYDTSVRLADYRYRYSRSRWGSSSSSTTYSGSWADTADPVRGYLGVVTSGGRYGWVEFDITGYGTGTVLSYGYETVAGAGLLAGQAPTPPVLAGSVVATPLPGGLVLLGAGLMVAAGARRFRADLA